MTNHKNPKRLKQKFYTAKGKEPAKAVSSDLLLQQSETSKSIKNYNTSGINYDKRIYNKLVRNMEAQKVASQSNDSDLKIKLKNYGDNLRNDLKKSVGKKRVTIPQNVQDRVIYRPESRQLNDDYLQRARDQRHQADTLTGDGNVVLATEVIDEQSLINNAERKILKLVSGRKYLGGTKPDARTKSRWATLHAGGDKAFVNTVLLKHYEETGTSATRKILREQAVKQAQIKTAMDLSILKRREQEQAVKQAQIKTELERAKIKQIRDAKTSSSAVSSPPPKNTMSTTAKNQIIRNKLLKYPANQTLTTSAKKRIIDQKLFKESGITMADLDKVIKKRVTIAKRKNI